MKAKQIVNQLRAVLPKYTDKFTDKINISSLTFSGGTVTAITSSVHGLSTGNIVNIVGALAPNTITSLTQTDNIATAITQNAHDLTEGYQQTINISGANQSEYNGDKTLLSVIDRNTFTFQVTGNPTSPATGTILLNEDKINEYNGRFQITVIDTTTFTYTIRGAPGSPASGTIVVKTKARITGAATIERAIEAYTKQNIDDYYIFVVLGALNANRDRYINVDATYRFTKDEEYRQTLIQSFSIFMIVPSKNQIAGRRARDEIEDIRWSLYKSIVGAKLDSGGSEGIRSGITIINDDIFDYNGAIYIHQFVFEITFDITNDDIISPSDNVAFRDIQINYEQEDDDLLIKTDKIKLDK